MRLFSLALTAALIVAGCAAHSDPGRTLRMDVRVEPGPFRESLAARALSAVQESALNEADRPARVTNVTRVVDGGATVGYTVQVDFESASLLQRTAEAAGVTVVFDEGMELRTMVPSAPVSPLIVDVSPRL